jgi:hypothetical protein
LKRLFSVFALALMLPVLVAMVGLSGARDAFAVVGPGLDPASVRDHCSR